MQQPKTLEYLALERLGQWILFQGKRISEIHVRDATIADDLLNRQIEIIRTYVRKLPHMYHDKLANILTAALNLIDRTIEMHYSQKITIGRMIETIYSKHLTCLSLCSKIYFASLSNSHLLSDLIDLTFSPGSSPYATTNIEEDTIQFLKELHKLKYLNLSYCSGICSIDRVLNCIADNCKQIEVLNLCYLECLNDENIEILTRLKNLRRVDVRDTGVTEKGIATLLMSCEHIEYIIIDENEIANALEDITSSEENVGKRFKLIAYENCRETTVEDLQLVVDMCPRIQKISITRYSHVADDRLIPIKDLQDLRKLELYAFEFYQDKVNELLQARGCNFVHLHLEDVEEIDLNTLICISETCPNLESLTFEECHFVQECTTIGHSLFQSQKPVLNSLAFRNLKRLYLRRLGTDAPLPTDEQLFFLLSTCPNIEVICTSRVPISDDLILRVLDKNPLTYLEELKLRQDRPAPTVVDRIIQNCVNISEVSCCIPATYAYTRRSSFETSNINSLL